MQWNIDVYCAIKNLPTFQDSVKLDKKIEFQFQEMSLESHWKVLKYVFEIFTPCSAFNWIFVLL